MFHESRNWLMKVVGAKEESGREWPIRAQTHTCISTTTCDVLRRAFIQAQHTSAEDFSPPLSSSSSLPRVNLWPLEQVMLISFCTLA